MNLSRQYNFSCDSTGVEDCEHSTEYSEVPWESKLHFTYISSMSTRPNYDDLEIQNGGRTYYAWIIYRCLLESFTARYMMQNNTISDVIITPANETLSEIVNYVINQSKYGYKKMEYHMEAASFSGKSTQYTGDRFARSFAATWLGMLAGVIVPAPTIEQQTRSTRLMAVIGKPP